MYIMGKKNRRAEQNRTTPPPSDFMPHSSRMDSLSKEKPSHSVVTSALKPLSSMMDIMDRSVKLSKHHSPAHHRRNLSRTILLGQPRHYYGHQYSRRNSACYAETSTSHGTRTPLRDEKLSFKFASSESGRHSERREKASRRPERIKSSSSAREAAPADVVKMVCGICHKLLKRKPYILENTMSSGDICVVAVLVCGHIYHADCLEMKTCYVDRRDPPCPLCVGLLSQV